MSIKKFILIGILLSSVVSFAILFFLNKQKTAEEVEEVYDAQLAQTSRIMQSFLARPKEEINFSHLTEVLATAEKTYNNDSATSEGHPYELKFGIQIWASNKQLLAKSPGMSDKPLSDFQDGYFVINMQGFSWNVFTHHMQDYGYWVMIAERGDIREEMMEDIIMASFIGPIAGMVILIGLIVLIIYWGLKPVSVLSNQIYTRHINKLHGLDTARVPKELMPLATAINSLMTKVGAQVDRERQFLGDIAHELRTPLSTIKLQAQSALKADDLVEARQALGKIVRGVDASTHLITQLLTLARLDVRALGEPSQISFLEITERLLATYRDMEKNIIVEANNWPADVEGYPVLIEVLIRNLLENAIRYTPVGKNIYININDKKDTLSLSVVDEGKGVRDSELFQLGRRFFSDTDKAADQTGSGLGLSIVARIAALHGATLEFGHNQPSGLCVKLVFKK